MFVHVHAHVNVHVAHVHAHAHACECVFVYGLRSICVCAAYTRMHIQAVFMFTRDDELKVMTSAVQPQPQP